MLASDHRLDHALSPYSPPEAELEAEAELVVLLVLGLQLPHVEYVRPDTSEVADSGAGAYVGCDDVGLGTAVAYLAEEAAGYVNDVDAKLGGLWPWLEDATVDCEDAEASCAAAMTASSCPRAR